MRYAGKCMIILDLLIENITGKGQNTKRTPESSRSLNQSWQEIVSNVPNFSYRNIDLDKRLLTAIVPGAILILSNIILICIALVAFNRYDVR